MIHRNYAGDDKLGGLDEPPNQLHDHCLRCHYDLHGISDDKACPECGLLAGRSRMPSDELRHSRPRWLKLISLGIWMILAGEIIPLVFYLAVLALVAAEVLWVRVLDDEFVVGSVNSIGVLLIVLGVWLITVPEGVAARDSSERKRRHLVRLLSLLIILPVILFWLLVLQSPLIMWIYAQRGLGRADNAIAVIACLIVAPFPLFLFNWLRSLARRVLDAGLAEHCAIVGWGWTLTALSIAAMSIAAHQSRAVTLSDWWLIAMLTVMVAVLLFLIWGSFLMIAFAVHFAEAARAARRAWDEADLSTAT